MAVSLPIMVPPVRAQRYSCHGCGNCCRDFTVQLRPEDLVKLETQGWEESLGTPITVTFRGVTYLRQREDGACIFLQEDGLCRIHAAHGLEAKPLACQFFPFNLAPSADGADAGLNFACQSVQQNRGAALSSHLPELRRLAAALPELRPTGRPPVLADRLRGDETEAAALRNVVEAWLERDDVTLDVRVEGLSWFAQTLMIARLEKVREERFLELLSTLSMALPDELELLPDDPPTRRHLRLLRQGVHARTEDVRLDRIEREGRWRIVLGQLRTSRRFARGRGSIPRIGVDWPEDVSFQAAESVAPATDDATSIDDLITRYLRTSVLGERFHGGAYYGWSMVSGLAALALNVLSVAWLARVHAAGRGLDALDLEAVSAALGRIDRHSGRAAWLGSAGERWRIRYLAESEGLQRLARGFALTATSADAGPESAEQGTTPTTGGQAEPS